MLLCRKCHGNCQCLSPDKAQAICLLCGAQGRATDCKGYLPPETGQEAVAPWMEAMATSEVLATAGRVELRVWGYYVTSNFAKSEARRLITLGQGTMKEHPVMRLNIVRTDTELDDKQTWTAWFAKRAAGSAPGHLLLVQNFSEYLVLVVTPTADAAQGALRKMEAARTLAERIKAREEAKAQEDLERGTQALWDGLGGDTEA